MSVFSRVENFLLNFCSFSSPLLLALSGGADSLCLFYALLAYRKRYGIAFHIAHVNHGWRSESQLEADALQQLALSHQVPFHLRVLDPSLLKGNLEAACRKERYLFFAELCQQNHFQGVLTGHHQDDQAETVFKRILEGAHWSRWIGLKPESWVHGVRVLRPLLTLSKSEIRQHLDVEDIQAFEDPTNRQVKFLRARLRETIFPRLNQEFGKRVQNSLLEIREETEELVHYFEALLTPFLEEMMQGPWGSYLNLQKRMPASLLEIKYLLRLVCHRQGFFLSRVILEQAAQALQANKANQLFMMGGHQIEIDRQRLFVIPSFFKEKAYQTQEISPGSTLLGKWKLDIVEEVYSSKEKISSWEQGWQGQLKNFLPQGNYRIGFKEQQDAEVTNLIAVKKRWNQAKVPAFLYSYFPLIWGNGEICHEFLTGKPLISLEEGRVCWKIELNYLS